MLGMKKRIKQLEKRERSRDEETVPAGPCGVFLFSVHKHSSV